MLFVYFSFSVFHFSFFMINRTPLLFLNVFIIATCGLIYELIAGTLASYVLGDSVTQFSLIIGIYLFAMGVGSYFSRFIEKHLAEKFIDIEYCRCYLRRNFRTAAFFSHLQIYPIFKSFYMGTVFGIGTLVGLEIPLLMRLLKGRTRFQRIGFSRSRFLIISEHWSPPLLFPLFLVPKFGFSSHVFSFRNAKCRSWNLGNLATLAFDNKELNAFKSKRFCYYYFASNWVY